MVPSVGVWAQRPVQLPSAGSNLLTEGEAVPSCVAAVPPVLAVLRRLTVTVTAAAAVAGEFADTQIFCTLKPRPASASSCIE